MQLGCTRTASSMMPVLSDEEQVFPSERFGHVYRPVPAVYYSTCVFACFSLSFISYRLFVCLSQPPICSSSGVYQTHVESLSTLSYAHRWPISDPFSPFVFFQLSKFPAEQSFVYLHV